MEITEAGLRTADGEEHCVDTIIYGTGFKANEYLSSVTIHGRDGRIRDSDTVAPGRDPFPPRDKKH